MNLTVEQAIIGGIQLATIVAMWTRLETRFSEHAKQSNRRLDRAEKEIGIENGNKPGLVRRGECEDREERSNHRLADVERKAEDHEHRITVMETRLPVPQ